MVTRSAFFVSTGTRTSFRFLCRSKVPWAPMKIPRYVGRQQVEFQNKFCMSVIEAVVSNRVGSASSCLGTLGLRFRSDAGMASGLTLLCHMWDMCLAYPSGVRPPSPLRVLYPSACSASLSNVLPFSHQATDTSPAKPVSMTPVLRHNAQCPTRSSLFPEGSEMTAVVAFAAKIGCRPNVQWVFPDLFLVTELIAPFASLSPPLVAKQQPRCFELVPSPPPKFHRQEWVFDFCDQ